MHRALIQGHHAQRIGAGAPVYMAATTEYLVAELLDMAGSCAVDHKAKRITPRHIYLAVENDKEFKQLFANTVLTGSGVLPHIEKSLLPAKQQSKLAEAGETEAKPAVAADA